MREFSQEVVDVYISLSKLSLKEEDGGFSNDALLCMFGTIYPDVIFKKYTLETILKRIDEFMMSHVEVGSVVKSMVDGVQIGKTGVVTKVTPDVVMGIQCDGTPFCWGKNLAIPTGEIITPIADFIKEADKEVDSNEEI